MLVYQPESHLLEWFGEMELESLLLLLTKMDQKALETYLEGLQGGT